MSSMSFVIALPMSLGPLLWWISRRVARSSQRRPLTAHWIEELSLERYRPMMRLLDPDDLEFLRSQPGFTWRMASRLRAQRCQLFRSYLRSLDEDFQSRLNERRQYRRRHGYARFAGIGFLRNADNHDFSPSII